MTNKKNVLIGITGGIAVYKIPYLIRLFKKSNFEVKVVATKNALKFVGLSTLETLTGNKVLYDLFENPTIDHVDFAKWADVFIIAPATANIIGKMANGICDDALSTTIVAYNKDVILCPAMNTNMYFNYAVQKNISFLRNNGVHVLGPVSGELSCGDNDIGRMIEVENIYHYALRLLKRNDFWRNKRVVLVGGGTREYIDDVRYIGNISSGRMAVSLLKELYYRGSDITFIHSDMEIDIPPLQGITVKKCMSVKDIVESLNNVSGDILIMPSAISDFTVDKVEGKIRRNDNITLQLKKTPDVLSMFANKYNFSVGFSLGENINESDVMKKIDRKKVNIVVSNDITNMGTNRGKIVIFSKKGKLGEYEGDKKGQASFIVDTIEKYYGEY